MGKLFLQRQFIIFIYLQSLYDDGTETTRKQLLMSSESLRIANDGCVDQLLDVWRGVVKRVYHLYQLSAKAYFIFLQLNDLVSAMFLFLN